MIDLDLVEKLSKIEHLKLTQIYLLITHLVQSKANTVNKQLNKTRTSP